MRKFALEFSGAAEGLGYNEAALKDLFDSALDEPLSWWNMRGLDHLTFGEFVEFLARSPAKVAQVAADEAAEPPVGADKASAYRSRRQRRNRRKASSTLHSLEAVPEPVPFHEPIESALVQEPTESTQVPAPEWEQSEPTQDLTPLKWWVSAPHPALPAPP